MSKLFKRILGGGGKKILDSSQISYEGGGDIFGVEKEKQDNVEWLGANYDEGQLSIDVCQTPTELVVKSTIAGVKPEDIDISLHNDMLTIRGKREESEKIKEEDYLYKECFWGSFSRSIILPLEVNPKKIKATLENGILTIIMPKIKITKDITIKVKEK